MQIERFVAVVGLPRSGTTLLTALLDAHPRFCLYYEPWNASKKAPPPVLHTLEEFRGWMEPRFQIRIRPEHRVTGFKETTILPAATAWATATIDAIAKECPTQVIWIFRDPILCLLSKVEGARKWWGYPDAAVTRESLLAYLRESLPSLRALSALAERHPVTLLRYDALVQDPAATLAALMASIGERFDPIQLAYHEAGPRPNKVMGDVEVATAPAPVSGEREARRRAEAESYAELVESTWREHPELCELQALAKRLLALPPVAPLGSHPNPTLGSCDV